MGENSSVYNCVTEVVDRLLALDISNFVPANYLRGITDNHVVIGSRVSHSTFKLKRYLNLNADICWAIGFFLAEGTKCSYMVSVSNCEHQLVDKFRNIIEKQLFTTIPSWRYYIKSSSNEIGERVWHKKYSNSQVFICKCKIANRDNVEIRFNNRPLAYTFNSLAEDIAKKAVLKPQFALPFLKGYAIGDGSVINRKGYLYGVSITVKNTHYKNLLLKGIEIVYGKNVRIRTSKGCHEISMTGINLMNKLILDGWFSEVLKQRRKLVNGFIKKEYTRSHLRYWKALRGRTLGVTELAAFVSRSHWAVRDAMKKDANYNLIKIKSKRVPGLAGPHHKIFELTNSGESLLNSILEVKNGKK